MKGEGALWILIRDVGCGKITGPVTWDVVFSEHRNASNVVDARMSCAALREGDVETGET